MFRITEEQLDELRDEMRASMSPKRFFHTAEVEAMAARLGELYCPEKIPMLRAAALLHDVTKEYSPDCHLLICAEHGLTVGLTDLYAPKTLHARTAAALIPERYPSFNDGELIGCVRWHTTGRSRMTLCEKLIYLADYIDLSRRFPDCVRLREFFFDAKPEQMTQEQRFRHLRDTLILSFDMTIAALLEEGTPISPDSFEARNALVCERLSER